MANIRISKKTVDALMPEAKRYKRYDTDLKGFGIRVLPSGTKTYLVTYRPNGGGRSVNPQDYTIGNHGVMTPDQARDRAKQILHDVHVGLDPHTVRVSRRSEMTMDEFCELYIAEGFEHKKPSTRYSDLCRIRSHIRPLLGSKRLSEITQNDIEKFQRDVARGLTAVKPKPSKRSGTKKAMEGVATRTRHDAAARGGKGTASRTVGLLGGMFTFALKHPDTKPFLKVNPVTGVVRYKDGKRLRHLSAAELDRLSEVLERSEINRTAVSIILMLALTGARKGEIEGLEWDQVATHLAQLQLGDSKTGFKIIHLSSDAIKIIEAQKSGGQSRYIFPATNGTDRHFVGTSKIWPRIRMSAGLAGVRLHDLRHTFASTGIMSVGSLPLVGKMLGHKDLKTTERYAHLADTAVKTAVASTSGAIATALKLRQHADLTEVQKQHIDIMKRAGLDVSFIAQVLGVGVDDVVKARPEQLQT